MASLPESGPHGTADGPRPGVKNFPALTPRELEVLDALRKGARTHASIAAALDVEVYTAETHVRNIHRKIQGHEGMDGPPLMACLAASFLLDEAGLPT